MKFTPELEIPGGCIKPLHYDDIDGLFELYKHPEIPGQRPLQDKEQLNRMIDYSVQMAATQRGMMWAIETEGQIKGMVSGFDWQPSNLRIVMRVDGLPQLTVEERTASLKAAIGFLSTKYHVRNFAYQWIEGQSEDIKTALSECGFTLAARLRDGWRTGNTEFSDVEQYHWVSSDDKPVPRKLGDDDELGQNLNANQRGES